MKSYRVNEVFYSLQGEGARFGSANVFVRFAGCNLTCTRDGEAGFDCDTEFSSGVDMTIDELREAMAASRWPHLSNDGIHRAIEGGTSWCILTGGEPGLQVDRDLVEALHEDGWRVAIETNGTRVLPDDIDYIACSPKTAEHTLRIPFADELRYVRHANQGIPSPTVRSRPRSVYEQHRFISPAFNADGSVDRATLRWCIDLCRANPGWRMSVQLHKLWSVR